MHLQLTTHNLEISFNCDSEDHYDHGRLLKQLAELIDELDNHTGVDLVITSTHPIEDSDSDSDDDEWTTD
jgi:hypothetical protein